MRKARFAGAVEASDDLRDRSSVREALWFDLRAHESSDEESLSDWRVAGLDHVPILLGITMWLQFKLNPPATDPIQKQMFAIMPWVLMFAMAPFAAGLQLYWTVNNILTILQQKWLYSRYPGMKAVPDTPEPVK